MTEPTEMQGLPPLPPRYRFRDLIWGDHVFVEEDRWVNLYNFIGLCGDLAPEVFYVGDEVGPCAAVRHLSCHRRRWASVTDSPWRSHSVKDSSSAYIFRGTFLLQTELCQMVWDITWFVNGCFRENLKRNELSSCLDSSFLPCAWLGLGEAWPCPAALGLAKLVSLSLTLLHGDSCLVFVFGVWLWICLLPVCRPSWVISN